MNNSDEPAFPDPARGCESSLYNQDPLCYPAGLTKREYFAAMAMQGIIASGDHKKPRFIATSSLAMADELLKQLNQDADFAASLKA